MEDEIPTLTTDEQNPRPKYRERYDSWADRRRGTIHVPGRQPPRPAPKAVPETDRTWRPTEFHF